MAARHRGWLLSSEPRRRVRCGPPVTHTSWFSEIEPAPEQIGGGDVTLGILQQFLPPTGVQSLSHPCQTSTSVWEGKRTHAPHDVCVWGRPVQSKLALAGFTGQETSVYVCTVCALCHVCCRRQLFHCRHGWAVTQANTPRKDQQRRTSFRQGRGLQGWLQEWGQALGLIWVWGVTQTQTLNPVQLSCIITTKQHGHMERICSAAKLPPPHSGAAPAAQPVKTRSNPRGCHTAPQ